MRQPPTGWARGWVLPLRLARRDALRSRGRSVLVLVLILLPVLAVTTAAVVARTTQVSSVEGLDRRLGSAQALVTVSPGSGQVVQGVDPEKDYTSTNGDGSESVAGVRRVLGDAPTTPVDVSTLRVESTDGVADVEATELDLDDPLTRGLFRLVSGRLPAAADEVVANQALLDRGYAVGDTLRLVGSGDGTAPAPRIVGVAESTALRTPPVVAGPKGSLGVDTAGTVRLLVGGGPVSWQEVQELNQVGGMVLSRAVVSDPPPFSQLPEEVRQGTGGTDATTTAVLALIAAMVLLEVVLLAGPAFAVGARRQARSLALIVASGGTPAQARRTVLATAVVLGSVAAVAGAVLGVLAALALVPVAQRFSDTYLGPFDVPWLVVAGVAGLGLLSALLAALVPAVLASRQDVVAVLAGRRGEPRPSRRSPVLGVVLLGAGIGAAVLGASGGGGELAIALAGVSSVLGMILLVPLVLAVLGRAAGRLPLALCYSVRDAARQRTRTAPAVAAVAATVAGVVALGIGASSDNRENEATYQAQLPMGTGAITLGYVEPGQPATPDWQQVRARVAAESPDAVATDVDGVTWPSDVNTYGEVRDPGNTRPPLSASGAPLGSTLLVASRVGDLLPGLSDAASSRADAALRDGQAVVPTDDPGLLGSSDAMVVVTTYDEVTGEEESSERDVPAAYVTGRADGSEPAAVLAPALAERLDLPVAQVGLRLGGQTLDEDAQQTLTENLAAMPGGLQLYVERGYTERDSTVIALLVLGALGAVLVLGGTLTATFLSLADARPDLATLAAVGASPGTRRGVAAAYALVVATVGGVLGALVGFVPGLAVAVPLTSSSGPAGPTGPYIDVPWLLVLGLVVLLPLLSAGIVAATTRSRLPLVARAA